MAGSILIMIGTGVLFAISIASVVPAPYTLADHVFLAAFGAYLAVGLTLRARGADRRIVLFGLITFACFALTNSWYWYGTFQHGWWFPPQLPWVQQLWQVDGEASYDAAAANFFVTTWLASSVAFWSWSSRRRFRLVDRSA